ncbi:MAG: tyrosine-type recombinase/integrase [Halieaceae bacterium]|nr:tyrosine-type recombinase/integrase [Halieaceae bacterium]
MSKAIIEQYLRDRENGVKTTKPVVKLTQALIDWLPIADKEYSVGEALVPSLSVRVRPPSGSKTFYVVRKVNGRAVRSRICNNYERPYSQGSHSVLAVAKRVVVELQDGITPAIKKQKKKLELLAAQKLSKSVDDACNDYINAKSRKKNTTQGYERFKNTHLAGWRDLALSSITEDDVAELHDEITDKVGPVAANNVLRFFRSVWNFHKRKLDLGDSPTIIFTKEGDNIKDWHPESRRVRYVSKEELRPWWEATERLRTDYDGDGDLAADYLQFAVLTGLRRREITNLEWDDINSRRKTFTITDNKSKRPYSIPITDELSRILDRRSTASRPFDFDDPKRFIQMVSGWSGVQFSSHDLRRTFLSHATAAGIPLPIQKALVNHSREGDVTEGYIQIDIDALRDAAESIQSYICKWCQL